MDANIKNKQGNAFGKKLEDLENESPDKRLELYQKMRAEL
jgi:hypothetical protein